MNALTKHRDRISIHTRSSVELVIGGVHPLDEHRISSMARFVCVTCEGTFEPNKEWFVCSGCGVELTNYEVLALCDEYSGYLESLARVAGRRAKWSVRLRNWLTGVFRRRR